MAVDKDILFMLGCPRSGTTFLNNMLREEMDVGFGPELQMIPRYVRRLHRYGDVSREDRFRRLVRDMLSEGYVSILENVYSRKLGKQITIREEEVLRNAPERTLSGAVYALLKTTADVLDKKYVGNKHLVMLLHPDWLEELFPNCRVIHVIRDGRDCALSLKRMRWGHTNAYAAARFWARHINNGKMLEKKLGKNRYIEVIYEKFLEDPINESDRMWKFISGENADEGSKSFDHVKSSVKSGNSKKWKQKMSELDAMIFQGCAEKELEMCGYELMPASRSLSLIQKLYYMCENEIHREYNVRFRKDMRA